MAVATRTTLHCPRCGRTWRPAGPLPAPRACPVCHPDRGRPGRSPLRRAVNGGGYRSLRAFYEANAHRVPALEPDYGLWWRDEEDGPIYRAAWVDTTGELYVVRCDAPADGGGDVEVLAIAAERDAVDRALSGWRKVCGGEGSLSWLRRRASALAVG